MKRIGIIDFDTSHVYQFVRRLNHIDIDEDQWVDGAQIVVGCPGKSVIYPHRIPVETEKVRSLGLPLVDTPEKMLEYELDAVFIESNSGMQHLERARFFLDQGLALFVDKPFACSTADARAMIDLAKKVERPIMSASSLRYSPEVASLGDETDAAPEGVLVYGPAPTDPKNPGLFHYGIHAVEILYTLMGPGARSLVNIASEGADVVTAEWPDGRIATVRGNRPRSAYGFVAFADGKVIERRASTTITYRELLKQIVRMLETGKSPIPMEETFEIIEFIELARKSSENHSTPQRFGSS